MPKAQCAHCRGIPEPTAYSERPERDTSTASVGPRFRTGTAKVAEYYTSCPGCGDRIEPGDPIKKDSSETWVHEECA